MCKNCFVSFVATYFSVFFLLVAFGSKVNLWFYSLIITALLFVAVTSCPLINKEGWKCCEPKKGKVKKKK